MLQAGLRAFLLARPEIASLVGTRIYPEEMPEKAAFPALTYSVISDVAEQGLDGPAGLGWKRIEITAWAKTAAGAPAYDAAYALADLVRTALDGASGIWGGVIDVDDTIYDGANAPENDTAAGTCGVPMDFIIWHRPMP